MRQIFHFIFLGLILFFFAGCFTQKTAGNFATFKGKYAEFLTPEEIETASGYHYVISKNVEREHKIRIFYPDTKQLTEEIECADSYCQNKTGKITRWFDNGNLRAKGQLSNNLKTGDWELFHYETKNLENQGAYQMDLKEGLWKNYDQEGRLQEENHYVAGLKEGPFTIYDKLGTVVKSGVYKADTIFEEQRFKESTEISELPILKICESLETMEERNQCTEAELLKYAYSNIKYPRLAREYSIEGLTRTVFIVDQKGEIENIEVVSGLCGEIKRQCHNVVAEMPEWLPGVDSKGKKVKIHYNLPIRFKLE